MIEAVVFDMDGLLIDSEPLWQRARIEAFGAGRLRWTEEDQQAVMGTSTIGWATMLAERLEHEYTVDEVIDRVTDQMIRFYHTLTPVMPGAVELLEQLNGHLPLGLASGSPYRLIDAALAGAGWTGVFSEVMSSDEVAQGKPAPDIYLEIARRLDVPAGAIAIFEDSANGILAGHAAGVRVIAVPGDYASPQADVLDKADRVIQSLHDFSLDMLDLM
ncbi:MAG: HAD family phosphatase [Anaerolineae bacterium]|nr:HAD family phosphatase [Anaerolineae bacterium]